MTASAHGHHPAWQALRPLRSVRVLWSALLVALLLLLPCSGSAFAAGRGVHRDAPAVTTAGQQAHRAEQAAARPATSGHHSRGDAPQAAPSTGGGGASLCSTYAVGGGGPDSGCSGGRHCLQDAVLPDAPPQPLAAVVPGAVLLPPAPVVEARGPLPGIDRAPDIHLLQVQRT